MQRIEAIWAAIENSGIDKCLLWFIRFCHDPDYVLCELDDNAIME